MEGEITNSIEKDREKDRPMYINALNVYSRILGNHGYDKGGEELGEGYYSEPHLDEEVVRNAIQQEIETEERVTFQWKEIQLPEDFDWKNESRRELRNAIDILHKKGVVRGEMLIKASKFAGPDNVEIDEEMSEGGKLSLVEYWKKFEDSPKRHEVDVMTSLVSEKRKIRNEQTKLKIHPDYIVGAAEYYKSKYNLPLTDEEIVRIVLAVVTGHEYGHAIAGALSVNLVDLEKIGKNISQDEALSSIRQEEPLCIEEHFAGGIERIVLRETLRVKGISEDTVENIIVDDDNFGNVALTQYLRLSKQIPQNEYSVQDFANYFGYVLHKNIPPNVNLQSIQQNIYYDLPVFSEEEIRQIIAS